MAPKIKATLKGKKKDVAEDGDIDHSKFEDSSLNVNDIEELINYNMDPSYDVEIKPSSWVLSNRKKFSNWLDITFKYKNKVRGKQQVPKCIECDEGESCVLKPNAISLFPHQNFIKDYMQFSSPYRGLLLLHGLGVGKTASSIAAAEILKNNMDVVIMLATSLEMNYINEIKKYGRKYYALRQRWIFVPIQKLGDKLPHIIAKLSLDVTVASKNGGIWIPFNKTGKKANFLDLPEACQSEINEQITNMIKNRFSFIHYDGLRRDHIRKMVDGGKNPFDNKCIVIDEVHNLISRIANGRDIGNAIYKLLMSAKNAKLIFLSGTPIINYPYEIAFMVNLLTGPRKEYVIQFLKDTNVDQEDIDDILGKNNRVDYYSYDRNTRKVGIIFLPEGFEFTDKINNKIVRSNIVVAHNILIEQLKDKFIKKGYKISKKNSESIHTTLPEKEDDFNNYFVDLEKAQVKNPYLFMKRVLGTVSYYSTYSPELYPSVEKLDVPVEMSNYQFGIYQKSRMKERSQEKNQKFKKKKVDPNNIFSNGGQVYRFYSRANCNFVFPESINRPYPSINSLKTLKEVDDLDETVEVEEEKDETEKDYNKLIKDAKNQLFEGDFLKGNNLQMYSPKFKLILDKIQKAKGTSLVYSQFRTVEGLGILGLVLKKHGFAEFKLKKVGDEWDIDIEDEDLKKPKYMEFTGNNEQTQILLKIFNSDHDDLPKLIKQKMETLDTMKTGTGNLYGSYIKTCMITQSGAEGISLKNVREVHILEPYWNHIRLDQVIGRAVRTCSHVALPPTERNVKVYVYYSKFSEKQLADDFTLKAQDKSKTSDEYIYDIAKRKKSIIDNILELLQRSSVDCGFHSNTHPDLKCFSFPVNMDDNNYVYVQNIKNDTLDYQYSKFLTTSEWEGDVYITKKGNFLVNKITKEVYDYDIYINSKKLVKIGVLKEQGIKKEIEVNLS